MSILFLLAQYMLLKRQTKLERQQNELQKIELVGTFAASTAHEIVILLLELKDSSLY